MLYEWDQHYDVSTLFDMPVESRNGITLGIAFDIVIATAFSWMSSELITTEIVKHQKSQYGELILVISWQLSLLWAWALRSLGLS